MAWPCFYLSTLSNSPPHLSISPSLGQKRTLRLLSDDRRVTPVELMPPISDGLEKHKGRKGRWRRVWWGEVGENEDNADTAISLTHRGRERGQWGRVREVDRERWGWRERQGRGGVGRGSHLWLKDRPDNPASLAHHSPLKWGSNGTWGGKGGLGIINQNLWILIPGWDISWKKSAPKIAWSTGYVRSICTACTLSTVQIVYMVHIDKISKMPQSHQDKRRMYVCVCNWLDVYMWHCMSDLTVSLWNVSLLMRRWLTVMYLIT